MHEHNGIADPDQLAMLVRVLDNYCRQSGILPHSPEREHIAATIMALYEGGMTDEERLAAALPAPVNRRIEGKRA